MKRKLQSTSPKSLNTGIMSKYVIDPIVNEPSKGGWMEEYTLSLAKSYAKSLDQMVYRHLSRFERFLYYYEREEEA